MNKSRKKSKEGRGLVFAGCGFTILFLICLAVGFIMVVMKSPILVIIVVGIIALWVISAVSSAKYEEGRKCPTCGENGYKKVDIIKDKSVRNGNTWQSYYKKKYTCSNCGSTYIW